MSVSVQTAPGVWVQCAGQGKAEYGASTVRTGTVTFTALENSWNVVEITFDTPMPDDDYLVIFESTNKVYVHVQQVMSKTINGFNAIVWNRDELTSSNPGYIKYTAFKLYTDTEYNQVLDALKVTTGTATINTTNAEVSNVYRNQLVKSGHVVEYLFRFNVKTNLGYGAVLFSGLPKPKLPTVVVGSLFGNGINPMFIINTNGELTTSDGLQSLSSVTQVIVSGTYITSE